MNNLASFLFGVNYLYPNPVDQQRARGLLFVNWGVLVVVLVALPFMLNPGFYPGPTTPLEQFRDYATLIIPFICVAIHLLLNNGWLRTATWLFIGIQLLVIGASTVGGMLAGNALLLTIPLVSAASLLGRRGLLTVFFLLTMAVLIAVIIQSRMPLDEAMYPALRWQVDLFIALLSLGVATLLLYVFNGLIQNLTGETLREVNALRQISRFAAGSKATTEDGVYAEAIQFIRTRLDYPFAQIFYTGVDGKLNRRIRVGLGVRTAAEQVSSVTIADGSAILEAASSGKPVAVSVDDAALRWSHFLPSTTHGVALPVMYQDTLLAVLDVQTEQPRPVSRSQIAALESLVEAVGITASHLRLVEALRQNIKQQEETTATLRSRLQELRLASTGVSGSWEGYIQQRGQEVFGFDLEGAQGTFIAATDLPTALRPVLETGALQITTRGNVKIVNVPINLRGEILGAMSFTVPKDRPLTERQLETAQIVANRLALALENKRLFEQTQAAAQRERKANEATNLLISATNVEAVINVAAASFNDALGAINTRIHLQPSLMSETKPKEEPVS